MAVNLTIAGQVFAFPTEGEDLWASDVTGWATAVSNQLLQRTGGNFNLTNDVNFGASFATIQLYLKSRSANIASAGFVRMARPDAIAWRNEANTADLLLAVDALNRLTFNGNVILSTAGGVLGVSQGGTGLSSYTVGDLLYAPSLNTLAALAIGANDTVMRVVGGLPAWGKLVDANFDAAAAIARSKLASGTANHVLINDPLGVMSSEAALAISRGGTGQQTKTAGFDALSPATTKADLIVFNGANNIRQPVGLDGQVLGADSLEASGLKWLSVLTDPMTTRGDLLHRNSSNVTARLAVGSAGKVIRSDGTDPSYQYPDGVQVTVTGATTLTANQNVAFADSALGAYTITLPSSATVGSGKRFFIRKTSSDTNAISVSDGASFSTTIRTNEEAIEVIADGTTYAIVARINQSICARYKTAAGQSIPNSTDTIVDFGTQVFDSHGAVTTGASWRFTAPATGKYQVSATLLSANGGGWAAGEAFQTILYKNGAVYTYLDNKESPTTHNARMSNAGSALVDLLAGDYIEIRCHQSSGAALALQANDNFNHVSISKVP